MIGFVRRTVSPCSSSMSRSTPCVLGCCGPMLMIIVSSSGGSTDRSAASVSDIRNTDPSSRTSSAPPRLGRDRGRQADATGMGEVVHTGDVDAHVVTLVVAECAYEADDLVAARVQD